VVVDEKRILAGQGKVAHVPGAAQMPNRIRHARDHPTPRPSASYYDVSHRDQRSLARRQARRELRQRAVFEGSVSLRGKTIYLVLRQTSRAYPTPRSSSKKKRRNPPVRLKSTLLLLATESVEPKRNQHYNAGEPNLTRATTIVL
jgi:hypothetical protein